MVTIRRILHPTDFSKASQHALQYASSLAQSTGAELVLLYAYEPQDVLGISSKGQPTEALLDPLSPFDAGTADREPVDPGIIRQLNALRPASADVKVSRVVYPGAAGDVICWLAQQHHCDLIVMGTTGRTGLSHLIFGSVAEGVLRNSRCPVLAVRIPRDGEQPLPKPPPHPSLASM